MAQGHSHQSLALLLDSPALSTTAIAAASTDPSQPHRSNSRPSEQLALPLSCSPAATEEEDTGEEGE